MGYFRFYRRLKIAPGITLNFSKSGVSTSLGPRGAKVTLGRHGIRQTIGIPGTGLHYTEYTPWHKKTKKTYTQVIPVSTSASVISPSRKAKSVPAVPVSSPATPKAEKKKEKTEKKKTVLSSLEKKLTISFLDRIFKPSTEINFIDGLRYFVLGQYDKALCCLNKALSIPDAAFFAGFIALIKEKNSDAADALNIALSRANNLGKTFEKLGVEIHFKLPITDNIDLHISKPEERAALFALAEAYQGMKNYQSAVNALSRLAALSPEDLIVKNSLAEIILEACPGSNNADDMFRYIIGISDGIKGDSLSEISLLYFRGCAQIELKLYKDAINTLSELTSKTITNVPELVYEIRYQRGIAYWKNNNQNKAKEDFLWLENKTPNYKNVRCFI